MSKGIRLSFHRREYESGRFSVMLPREVAGAREAGMKGYVVVREGNKPLSDSEKAEHKVLYDIGEILEMLQQ